MLGRLSAALVAAIMVLLVTAPAALAHVKLESSDPAEGAALTLAPTTVTLTFTGDITTADSVKVTAPDGSVWPVNAIEADGPTVTASVTAAGPAGVHGLTYQVTSNDGHTVNGTIRFTLTAAAIPTTTTVPTTVPTTPTTTTSPVASPTPAPPAVAPAASDSGLAPWVWVLIAVVAVAVATAGLLVVRKAKSTARG